LCPLAEAFDGRDDFVGGLDPCVALRGLVVRRDDGGDVGLQLGGRAVHAAPLLLDRLGAGAMLLADKAYHASNIRSQLHQQGVFANIPVRAGRKEPIVFSPHLYKARNAIEGFFKKFR